MTGIGYCLLAVQSVLRFLTSFIDFIFCKQQYFFSTVGTSCIYQLFRINLNQKILRVADTAIYYMRLILLGTKMTSLLQPLEKNQ